jgi:serine/threonine protein phosphatase PrpC
MSVHFISLCGKRERNEDQHTVILNLDQGNPKLGSVNMYAVYDGHGGPHVSKRVKELAEAAFMSRRLEYPLKQQLVKQLFNSIEAKLETDKPCYANTSGTTTLIVIEYKKNGRQYLQTMNIGDTRAVISRNYLGIPLTTDHKPAWFAERHRINKVIEKYPGAKLTFDGRDWRIKDLSVSRAFGDRDAKPYVSHLPEISKYNLAINDQFMIVACDGLWDVMASQDAVNFILDQMTLDEITGRLTRLDNRKNLARLLAEEAIARGSTDNVSAVIVFF